MKLNELVKKVPQRTLLEIVDGGYRRAWYGEPRELRGEDLKFFTGMEVECVDTFMAEVGENEFRPSLQVKVRIPCLDEESMVGRKNKKIFKKFSKNT